MLQMYIKILNNKLVGIKEMIFFREKINKKSIFLFIFVNQCVYLHIHNIMADI